MLKTSCCDVDWDQGEFRDRGEGERFRGSDD